MRKNVLMTTLVSTLVLAMTGCGGGGNNNPSSSVSSSSSVVSSVSSSSSSVSSVVSSASSSTSSVDSGDETTVSVLAGSLLDTPDTAEMCTKRDMRHSPDTSEAQYITLNSGQNTSITAEGIYVISGNVTNSSIVVEADSEAKVQLILNNVSITNQNAPAVYVKQADKVFVTTSGSNHLEVSGAYVPDGETNLDAVIFSRDDLVVNGTGSLEIVSAQGNGVSSKDDLKVTGGTISITSAADSLEANDSIRICGGDITIDTGKDGLHSENEDDDSVGYIFIGGGSLTITAADDAIRATSVVQIDAGDIEVITSYEGIEATYIQINDGTISVYSSDDGINATRKSTAYNIVIEVNGGNIYVEVGQGDTDCFDSNGDIYVNGGIIAVVGNSAFDRDGQAYFNGGSVTVNGQAVTTLPGMGGFGGGGGFF